MKNSAKKVLLTVAIVAVVGGGLFGIGKGTGSLSKIFCKHDYGDTASKIEAATCAEDGYEIWTCKKCGKEKKTVISEKKPHTYGAEVVEKASTCESEGKIKKVCTVCGHAEYSVIPKHNYNEIISYKVGSNNNEMKKTARCVCGATKEETIKHDHKLTQKTESKAATCRDSGCTGEVYCETCTDFVYTNKTISRRDHSYTKKIVEAKQPTCSTAGNTDIYVCFMCGSPKGGGVGGSYIEALDHTFKNGICTVCGTIDLAPYADSSKWKETVFNSGDTISGKVLRFYREESTDSYIQLGGGYGIKIVGKNKTFNKNEVFYATGVSEPSTGKVLNVKEYVDFVDVYIAEGEYPVWVITSNFNVKTTTIKIDSTTTAQAVGGRVYVLEAKDAA